MCVVDPFACTSGVNRGRQWMHHRLPFASSTVYLMPSTESIRRFIGELNNPSLSETGSSVYKKQYTSDDELDDLDTSINSIISPPGTTSSSEWMPKGYGRRKTVRYQLLREIWKEDGLQ